MKVKTTISDVAKQAGVATSTVSRVISGNAKISDETRNKVFQIMKELNYHPNAIAQSLVKNKSNNLGVVIPSKDLSFFANSFFQRSIMGIVSVASERHYDVLLSTGQNDDKETVQNFIEFGKVDGIIIMRTVENDKCIEMLNTYGFPYVVIGTPIASDSSYCIDNDNVNASYELTKHMINQCDGQVAFFGGDPKTSVTQYRIKGYKKALKEMQHEIDDELIVFQNGDEDWDNEFEMILNSKTKLKGIISMDDFICLKVLNATKKYGLNIPKDIKIASYNNSLFTRHYNPTITSVDINSYLLGKNASEKLIKLLDNKEVERKTIVPYKIIIGRSTEN